MYLIALVVLCILIFVHELGHFLLAKWNKVGVLAFSIGFGPIIWRKQKGETTYTFRLFPLGGFVRMVGDDPRAVDPSFDPVEGETKTSLEQLNPEEFTPEQLALMKDRSKWFLLKGFWPKFLIVLAGPAFNIIFAVLLAMASIFIYGAAEPVKESFIGDVVPNHPAHQAGIKGDDRILSINGQPVTLWTELAEIVRSSGGKPMDFEIERVNPETNLPDKININVVAEIDTSGLVSDEEREKGDVYRIGIAPKFTRSPVAFSDALVGGFNHVWFISYQTVLGIKGLILGHISSDNIAGPVRIFQEAGRSAEKGMEYLFGFMIFLSVSLAILNLLPIPVLDGGHILFFVIEAIIGGPLNLKFKEKASQVGFALLLALMLFAVSNDLLR